MCGSRRAVLRARPPGGEEEIEIDAVDSAVAVGVYEWVVSTPATEEIRQIEAVDDAVGVAVERAGVADQVAAETRPIARDLVGRVLAHNGVEPSVVRDSCG